MHNTISSTSREGHRRTCKKRDCNKNEESRFSQMSPAPVPLEPSKSAEETKFAPVPLSGKPFFSCIMVKSLVQSPYRLSVPRNFWSLLPAVEASVILSHRSKNWEVRYLGENPTRQFGTGWKDFVVDNKLMIGDGCVFELMDDKNLRFDVRILRGQVPELFASSGRSSETPIVIADD